jgi:carbon monoxide dehydrogenase subunit G
MTPPFVTLCMTVRVERAFELNVPPEKVWEFISDPASRARAISVVDSYEANGDGTMTWQVRLPIPGINATVPVETEETRKDPPDQVEFIGRSSALRVTGKHTVESTTEGCRLHNEFVVDGRLPGVEGYFKRNLDEELDNLAEALREEFGSRA